MERKISTKWLPNQDGDKSICLEVRKKVFVDEQKFNLDLELDEDDSLENLKTINFLLYYEEVPVGTARLCYRNQEKWYLTRFCVLKEYRGKKLGDTMLEICFEKCKEMEIEILYLSAQVYIMNFYKKHGFEEFGEIYYDEHVQHINMSKKFTVY